MIIFKKPYDFLNYFGVSKANEIRLSILSEGSNVKIKLRHLTGCEAYIVGINDQATIFVSDEVNKPRQRFCIAHELGHWMLDRGTPRFRCSASDIGGSKIFQQGIEARANRYAADLLMPEHIFMPSADNLEMSFKSVRFLKEEFRTSIMATAIRLIKYGSFPAIFAWYNSKTGKRINFVRCPDIPTILWPHMDLHHESYAMELLCRKQIDSGGPRRIHAIKWFNTKNAFDHDVYEHSIKGFGDTILTILWWKDESMIDELTD